MDPLADVLARAGARGALFAHSRLRSPWGLTFRENRPLSFHAVLDGDLVVDAAGHKPLHLTKGDLLLARLAQPYTFRYPADALAADFVTFVAQAAVPGQPGRYILDGAGPLTVFLCGSYTFTTSAADPLLRQLPELAPVRGAAHTDPALPSTLHLLAQEIGRSAPGRQTALDRILDLLLVYGLRTWFAQPDVAKPGWFQALDDVEVGTALRLMHTEPAHPWTLTSLAAAVGLSRSAFVRRFTRLVGQPPLTYLTTWRLTIAEEALQRPGSTLATVAAEVGYRSEFAFAAAFKRQYGTSPGRWRNTRRTSRAATTGQ